MIGTLIVVVAATLTISAMCSLLEATLYSTRVAALEAARLEGRHTRPATIMLALKRNISRPTSAILVLNTIANTAGATLAGTLAAELWGGYAIPIFSAGLTAAILFASEIIPKTLGAVHWRGLWPSLAWPLQALVTLLRPIVWVTDHVASLIARGSKAPVTTESEIVAMIRMGASAGQLTHTETRLLTAVFHFDDLLCGDAMIPWNDVATMRDDWDKKQCIAQIKDTPYSRYPVCDGEDNVLGILHVKELVRASETETAGSLMRPALRVPETLPVPKLMDAMQAERKQLAVAIDEYGNTTGIISVMDLVEEVFGTLSDELSGQAPEIKALDERTYEVSGLVALVRFTRELRVELPAVGTATRTLSGWLSGHLGRLPEAGDEITVPGATLTVETLENDRPDIIRVVLEEPIASE